MMNDLEVIVYRHSGDETGEVYDGWFYSKVYAVNGNNFLVYDDASNTAFDDRVPRFKWVCFDDFYHDICSNTYHCIVEMKEQNNEL